MAFYSNAMLGFLPLSLEDWLAVDASDVEQSTDWCLNPTKDVVLSENLPRFTMNLFVDPKKSQSVFSQGIILLFVEFGG